jgi:hypothetical protein
MYISITGLKPKGFRGYIRFWMHAIPSYNQARNAEGNRFCSVKKNSGIPVYPDSLGEQGSHARFHA